MILNLYKLKSQKNIIINSFRFFTNQSSLLKKKITFEPESQHLDILLHDDTSKLANSIELGYIKIH